MSEPVDHPLIELIKARLREFYREPAIVFWVFGFPLLMAIGLGVAFRSKVQPLPRVAVVRAEAEAEANATPKDAEQAAELEGSLLTSRRLQGVLLHQAEAQRQLARARVDLVVTVAPGHAEFLFDPKNDSGLGAKLIADDVLQSAAGRKNVLATSQNAVTRKGARYIDFLIPGLIAMNLMGSSLWGVGFNMVVARKRRLLRRYAVTPMRRSHFLLSYVASRSLFLLMELATLVGFGVLLFGTQVQGSWLTLGLFSFLGAGAFAGISLVVGARLDNTESATGVLNFIQLPMYVLSGSFFSYERFPEWLHFPIELLPLTALTNGLRAIYNEGAGFSDLGFEAAVLFAWGTAGFLVAKRTFRWQ
jgi:ABC-type multidrug transport system permease subunit